MYQKLLCLLRALPLQPAAISFVVLCRSATLSARCLRVCSLAIYDVPSSFVLLVGSLEVEGMSLQRHHLRRLTAA